jgi:hypothetical protein
MQKSGIPMSKVRSRDFQQHPDFEETPEELAAWRKLQERRRIEAMLPAGIRSPNKEVRAAAIARLRCVGGRQ